MHKTTGLIIFLGLLLWFSNGFSQDLKTTINANKKVQDSLRKVIDGEKDSIVFNAKYII